MITPITHEFSDPPLQYYLPLTITGTSQVVSFPQVFRKTSYMNSSFLSVLNFRASTSWSPTALHEQNNPH